MKNKTIKNKKEVKKKKKSSNCSFKRRTEPGQA